MSTRTIKLFLGGALFSVLLAVSLAAQAGLGDGFGQLLSGLDRGFGRLTGNYIEPTPGVSHFIDAVEHKGLGRPVLYIRPEVSSPGKAPAVVMLSYRNTTPQTMANVVNAGLLAAKYGVWVILPQAVLRKWAATPLRHAYRDDLGYLARVVHQATSKYPIDADRVYMAGLSNGGYMATKFACHYPDLLAGMAVVATTLWRQQAVQCEDNAPLPVFMVLGTDDLLTPYKGRFGLYSAKQALAYWAERNGCGAAAERTKTSLPNKADDGMHTVQTDIRGCSSGAGVRQLTVFNGGHAWPGADTFLSDTPLATSTHDFSATIKLWEYLRRFTRQ